MPEQGPYMQHKLLFSLQIQVREEEEAVYQKGVDSGQIAKMETRVRTTTHQHIASESSMFVWLATIYTIKDVFLFPPF